jgi:hypothetical protein
MTDEKKNAAFARFYELGNNVRIPCIRATAFGLLGCVGTQTNPTAPMDAIVTITVNHRGI